MVSGWSMPEAPLPAPDVANAPMLEAVEVSHVFDVSRPALQRLLAREGRQTLRAVDGVSFAIPRGTTLSLVGESGCGKSTVARLAVGLYTPSAGEIRFEGQPLPPPAPSPTCAGG